MKTRASNIELLRLISMICVLHIVCQSIKIDIHTISSEWILWNINKTLTISATYFSNMFYPALGAWLLGLPMFGRYAIIFPLAIATMIPVMLVDKLWALCFINQI